MSNKKILVLMDIDGTILSMDYRRSREAIMEVFHEVFGEKVKDEDLPPFSGSTDLGIVKYISDIKGIPFYSVLSAKNKIWESIRERFKPLLSPEKMILHKGASELIHLLEEDEDIVLGLLTGNNRDSAINKVAVFGLAEKFVDGAYGCEHYDRNILPKIAWDRFKDIYPDLEFGPENTVIIGDSEKDIICAKHSGSKVISVATGRYSKETLNSYKPDIVMDEFDDADKMLDMIKSLIGEEVKV